MTLRLCLSLLIAVLSSTSASASPPPGLPPLAMVENAIADAPDMAVARADIARARAAAERLRVGNYEVELSGGVLQRSVDGGGDFTEWSGGLSRGIRWPGKRATDAELARLEVAAAEAGYEAEWRTLALDFAELWTGWRRAAALSELLQEDATDAQEAASAQARRLANGAGREVELEQLQADAALAAVNFEAARAEAEDARSLLEARLPGLTLPDTPPPFAAPDALLSVLRTSLSDPAEAPRLRLARLARDQADLAARRARMDRRPDPRVGLEVFSERDGAESGLGVSVSIPLTGRARRAASQEAQSRSVAEAAGLRAAELEIRQVYQRAIRDARSAGVRLSAAERSTAAAESALDRVVRGREMGAITVSELIMARRGARNARRSLLEQQAAAAEAAIILSILNGSILEAR